MRRLWVMRAAIIADVAAVRLPTLRLTTLRLTTFWHTGILLAIAVAMCIPDARLHAQEQRYETPQYTTGGGSTLDKSFGLPSFGMPPQRSQEPAARVPEQPDFFAKTPEYDVQKPRSSTATLEMETPLFTTPEGSTTGDSTMTDMTISEPATSDGTMSRY